MIDIKELKKQYPVLEKNVYLDTAATMQKHNRVINVVQGFSKEQYANIHRGIYSLSQEATHEFENTRELVAGLLECDSKEIIFTKGATESFNLLATTIKPLVYGKDILISEMEHHANILPWQRFAKEHDMNLKIIPINKETFELDYNKAKEMITSDTALVSITHMSNVLGTINDVDTIKSLCAKNNALFVLDASQSIAHIPIKSSMADFICFSSHKIGGPTGVGVLYGKYELLDQLEPYQIGGDMVKSVSFESFESMNLPQKFEAGTPNIEGVIGFGEAIEILEEIGYDEIKKHESALLSYTLERLDAIEGLTIYGGKNGIISFGIKGIHSHDIAQILSDSGICVRAGHHCCMPLMNVLGVDSLTRVSLWMYNDTIDIDKLIIGLQQVIEVFS